MAAAFFSKRFPLWQVLVAVFILIVLVGVTVLCTREIPEYAQAPAIEARFAPQLEILRKTAETCPIKEHDLEPVKTPEKIEDFKKRISVLTDWSEQAENELMQHPDPALLGASIVVHKGHSMNIRHAVVSFLDYETEEDMWSPSEIIERSPDLGRPWVTLWYTGNRQLIKYKMYFEDPAGNKRGYEILLDLAELEPDNETGS